MEKNELSIRRVHLESFIQQLIGVFETGVDFVDIRGEIVDGQDIVNISVREDYYARMKGVDFDNPEDIEQII